MVYQKVNHLVKVVQCALNGVAGRPPVLWLLFLSNFIFLRPSVLDSGSATQHTDRQTDRQTDNSHQCIIPPILWGRRFHTDN